MPVGFWGDADGSRYRAAHFSDFPGVWRHRDWITFVERGTCVISGWFDATLNREACGSAQKRILAGMAPDQAASRALADPSALAAFEELARRR